jgi:hypothetical protein
MQTRATRHPDQSLGREDVPNESIYSAQCPETLLRAPWRFALCRGAARRRRHPSDRDAGPSLCRNSIEQVIAAMGVGRYPSRGRVRGDSSASLGPLCVSHAYAQSAPLASQKHTLTYGPALGTENRWPRDTPRAVPCARRDRSHDVRSRSSPCRASRRYGSTRAAHRHLRERFVARAPARLVDGRTAARMARIGGTSHYTTEPTAHVAWWVAAPCRLRASTTAMLLHARRPH